MIVFGSKVNWISENGRAKRIKIAYRVHFPTSVSWVYNKESERNAPISIQ